MELNLKCLQHKCLGLVSDVAKLVAKLKIKLGFVFRNESCFSLQVEKCLIMTTVIPLVDYGNCPLFVDFFNQSLLGLVHTYLSSYICKDSSNNSLRSQDVHHRTLVPRANKIFVKKL